MFIKYSEKCFNYHGRWENVGDGMKSHWTRPYVEFYCNKDFSIVLSEGSGKYRVLINGEKAEAESNIYKLPENSLIRLIADETANAVTFKGIETEGKVGFAKSREKNILFIGDSLTHSAVSHSVLLPKWWDCDYTCIAQSSMALCVDRGYINVKEELSDYRGMSAAFFCLTHPAEGIVPPVLFDFESEVKYDAVILNIGTNDHLTDESWVDGFVTVYREFVKKLNVLYPDIPIYLALPVADTKHSDIGWRRNTIEMCAKEAERVYPNMKYISSRGWDVEISEDGVHPTTEGYRIYAEELKKAIGKI